MLACMSFTQVDLDAVRRAIATGELTVRQADRTVTYRSMDELLKAEQRIALALANKRRPLRFSVADFSDG